MNIYTGTTDRSDKGNWYWEIRQNGEVFSSGGEFSTEWEAYEALCKELASVEAMRQPTPCEKNHSPNP